MPVMRCSNGKYRIGRGKCMYNSKADAESAYRGYLGAKYSRKMMGGVMENRFNFFVPISKLDEEKRMVYGVATNAMIDNQNEIVDYQATKKALEEYSKWRNIREMHKPSAVGVAPILELRDDKEELFVGAKIVDDPAWIKCKEGVYKGFSIGGETLDRRVELDKVNNKTINRVTKYLLNEISLVDRPANPSCVFQTVKRDTAVETITISEDPLKEETSRVMEKAIILSKRILSKKDLEALPDAVFGLIRTQYNGDKLIKHRDYPMPDRVHAINMIRKMVGCDELTVDEKNRIHDTALLVLGKKHVDTECPYCINLKLKGGVEVSKDIKKQVTITEEPEKKTVRVIEDKPAHEADVKPAADAIAGEAAKKPVEEQKPNIVVEDDEGEATVTPADNVSAKLDQIISLLQSLMGEGEDELEQEENFDEEGNAIKAEEAEEESVKIKVEDEDEDEEEDDEAKAKVKPAEEEDEDEEDDEACKAVKAKSLKKIKKVKKVGLLSKIKAIIEPLAKENRDLKTRIEKMEKQPMPRKDSKEGDKPTKVEKYQGPTAKVQDVKLEKAETTFSEELNKDIAKANDLRKSEKTLTKDEETFCQRVAERMLDEKLSK